MKFKIGDKVVVREGVSFLVGRAGEIDEVGGDDLFYGVRFLNRGCIYFFKEEDLELVSRATSLFDGPVEYDMDEPAPRTAKPVGMFVPPGPLLPTPPVSTNPKAKFGATKPQLHLIPPAGLLHAAMAFERGARLYSPYNWRTSPVDACTYISAIKRHIDNWLDGEEYTSDDETVHNLGAIMASCAILLDAIELGNLVDNRPPKGKSSQVQDRMKAQKIALNKEPV